MPVSKRPKKKAAETSSRTMTKATASRGKAPIRVPSGTAPKKARTTPAEPTCDNWKQLDSHEYFLARTQYNPYEHPRTSDNQKFWCEMHEDIYQQIIQAFKGPVVEQCHFNVPFLQQHYPHEMGVLQFHKIDHFMAIQQDYCEELIKEFFATVYFSDDVRKTMTWMSAGQKCSKTIRECALVWKFPIPVSGDCDYIQIHDESVGVLPYTPYLDMAYPPGGIDAPNISSMSQVPPIQQGSSSYHCH
jgi:hypothetical protein